MCDIRDFICIYFPNSFYWLVFMINFFKLIMICCDVVILMFTLMFVVHGPSNSLPVHKVIHRKFSVWENEGNCKYSYNTYLVYIFVSCYGPIIYYQIIISIIYFNNESRSVIFLHPVSYMGSLEEKPFTCTERWIIHDNIVRISVLNNYIYKECGYTNLDLPIHHPKWNYYSYYIIPVTLNKLPFIHKYLHTREIPHVYPFCDFKINAYMISYIDAILVIFNYSILSTRHVIHKPSKYSYIYVLTLFSFKDLYSLPSSLGAAELLNYSSIKLLIVNINAFTCCTPIK